MTGPELPDVPAPGFRVTVAELTNGAAYEAMDSAAASVVGAALAARLMLLRLGFADTHSVCVELDATARDYANIREAIRVQSTPPGEYKKPS